MNSLPSKRDEIVPEVTEKVRISGIKLSSELVLLYVPDPDNSGFSISPLFHILNEKRINMPFVAVSSMDTGFSGSCCVSSQDIDHVRNIVDADDIFKNKGSVHSWCRDGIRFSSPTQYEGAGTLFARFC